MRLQTLKQLAVVPLASALLVACGSDNDNNSSKPKPPVAEPKSVELQISITNLTAGQPQSPSGVIVHRSGYLAFDEGKAASVAIEQMAEGGDAKPLLAEANANSQVLKTYEGPAAVGPGANRTFTMKVDGVDNTAELYLTSLTMLVNTNDAFTGVNNVALGNLAVGESKRWNGPVWDAGTELNSEASGTIPGPADTSSAADKGFNAERNDLNNKVVFHPGVITQAEGLASSVLTVAHRFDQPAVAIRVTRVK